jgi:capsular exopolysaccharide synthesis family protein
MPALAPGARVPVPALAATPSFFTLLVALRRRWLLALGLGLALGVAAGAGTWFVPGLSRNGAYALVRVSAAPSQLVFNTSDSGVDLEKFQKTQAAILKRRSVLETGLREPEVADLPVVREQGDQAAPWLERELLVDVTLGPEVMRITLKGERTDQLVKVLNAVTRAYLAESERMEQAERTERLEKVTAAAGQQEEDLRRKKQALRDLAGAPDDADAATAATRQRLATEQLSHAESELFQVQSELARLQADVEARQRKDPTANPAAIADYVVEEQLNTRLEKDPVEQVQITQIATLEQQLQEIQRVAVNPETQSAPINRQLQVVKAAREARHSQMKATVLGALQEKARADSQTAIADAKDRITVLKDRERLLSDQVKHLDDEAHPLKRLGPEAEKLQAEITKSESFVKKVSEQAQALKLEMAAPPRVTLLQEAVVTPRDDRRQLQIAGLAGLGVFACTVLGISWWEFRSRRISTPDEVAQGLGLRLLGALPRLPDRVRRRLAEPDANQDFNWHNLLNESIDVTRTLLIHDAQAGGVQVVMVTSAAEGEGKTTLASHLAASLARAGRKTLLIDGDLRKPAAHQLFDLPLEPGFSELLRGEVHVADVIRPTRLSRLWLISAGLCDNHATQALAQDSLHGVFEELRGQFDFIIIDSCPVLPVADSLLIGQYVDGVIFSILRDESRLPRVYAAYQRLAVLGIRMLGAVVNGTGSDSYGSGYRNGAVQQPVG